MTLFRGNKIKTTWAWTVLCRPQIKLMGHASILSTLARKSFYQNNIKRYSQLENATHVYMKMVRKAGYVKSIYFIRIER